MKVISSQLPVASDRLFCRNQGLENERTSNKTTAFYLLLITLIFLSGCGPPKASRTPNTIGISAVTQVDFDKPEIDRDDILELPVSVFILDDTQQTFTSDRTVENVVELHREANEIWSQAGIRVTFNKIKRGKVPIEMTAQIIRWEVDDFFAAQAELNRNFRPTTPLSGYFVSTVRGPNGIASAEHLAYFIADDPINNDARVVAHEIGHLLGLVHVNDPNRLMHSGSNGTGLTAEEIVIARQMAENILNRD